MSVLIEEQTRAVWRRPWIDQLWQDLLFALRILRRAGLHHYRRANAGGGHRAQHRRLQRR
jgi:hypothetical protein